MSNYTYKLYGFDLKKTFPYVKWNGNNVKEIIEFYNKFSSKETSHFQIFCGGWNSGKWSNDILNLIIEHDIENNLAMKEDDYLVLESHNEFSIYTQSHFKAKFNYTDHHPICTIHTNWDNVEVDTPVWFRHDEKSLWEKGHFAGMVELFFKFPSVWNNGRTSHTAESMETLTNFSNISLTKPRSTDENDSL